LRTILARVALASLVLATGAWAQGPVTDDLGREVRLAAPPERVVSMIPSHTETVCALGACDRLVGVDTFSNHPDGVADLPDLGSAFDADLERLIALEPDLVLTDEYSGLAEALAPLGIPVYAGMAERTDEVWEIVAEVAALLDRRAAGALLIGRAEGRVEALTDAAPEAGGPRVFVELDATPYSVGPRSYLGQLLRRAGARNIVPAELGDFPQVDPELVIEADPEVILLLDAPFGERLETVAERPGWAGIDAVRSGRVIELTQDQVDVLTRPGPRLPEALALLLDLLAAEDR
ncbi:MAG: ABC transporter substrate-binding protein, partial [Deinococcus-Thermus bacterium]|jgi:iron complex transport system substrate-binding protein|nr:ABC transporter substrate-binding protein [Deinococcota bacterium]